MNFETLVPTAGWLIIVAIVAAPAVTRLIRNLRLAYRIRQHKKNLPGPLLGVVYPEHKDSTILTENNRKE